MRASDLLAGSIGSLLAHPLRSVLTVLGVVTGVAAVIVVIAAGEGSRRTVVKQLELLGARLLIVLPGPASGAGGRVDSLDRADAEAMEKNFTGIRTSPEVLANVSARHGRIAITVPVVGATPSFASIRNFQVEAGRFFTPGEDRGRVRVCVVGSRTAKRLFPDRPAPGEYIKLDGTRYQVVGVFSAKGDLGWFHPDDLVVVPLGTAQVRLLGIRHIHAIAVECPSQEGMEDVFDRVVALLRRRHDLDPNLPKERLDFHVINQREMIETMSAVSKTLTTLLLSLAAVALITGGIGIMNIMLVSTTERTAEIGIRKAVGATSTDIFLQFLAEAVMLSGAGALIGIGVGAAAAELLSGWGGWEPVITGYGILLSVSVALLAGLVFGIYPALRAAAMEPVEALRG